MDKLPFYLSMDDVLLIPQRSYINSRSEVDLTWNLNGITRSIPIIAINMDCVTGVNMAIAMGKAGALAIIPRFDTPEIQADKVRQVKSAGAPAAAALGIKEDDWQRLEMLMAAGADHISIDVAHGHLNKVLEFVSKIRKVYPKLNLSAGVVGTYDAAKDLFSVGVDIIRVGVGPGTICTTRLQTGCGAPQFTALLECSRAARKFGKIIWADGGTKNSGDIVKCLAAGASAVIAGSQLAGCEECPVEIVEINGKKYKPYNASTSATEKLRQLNKYSANKDQHYVKHVEGIEGFVPYKGPVAEVLEKLVAGIRSGYSYCNAKNTPELWKNARFCQVTALGIRENASGSPVLRF